MHSPPGLRPLFTFSVHTGLRWSEQARHRWQDVDMFAGVVTGAAIQRASEALREAQRDPSRLEGYTWHGNRPTFASRLVMAGVNLRTVQAPGGWRTLSMVQRHAQLAPEHLHAAVERVVQRPAMQN